MCPENPAKSEWRSLKCPTCGNDRRFIYTEGRNRRQPLLVERGELYWGPVEDTVDNLSTARVYCADCEATGGSTSLWPPWADQAITCATASLPNDPGPDPQSKRQAPHSGQASRP